MGLDQIYKVLSESFPGKKRLRSGWFKKGRFRVISKSQQHNINQWSVM